MRAREHPSGGPAKQRATKYNARRPNRHADRRVMRRRPTRATRRGCSTSKSLRAALKLLIEEVRFASDSALEGDGFELPVPGREKASPFRGVGTVREATNGGISKWELMLDRWVRSVPRIRLITHAEPLTAPLPRGGALLTLCEALYADRAIPAASRNGGLRPACRDERSTAASTRRSA
jgi:hypothetical protein